MADDVQGDAQPQVVGVEPLQLRHDHPDILASLGDLRLGDALQSQGVGQGVGVRADAAHPLHQNDGLDEVPLHRKLFDTSVVIADEDLGVGDLLTGGIESGVDRLLQRGMVRADGDDIAHINSPPYFGSS